jgi:hypothetical protein
LNRTGSGSDIRRGDPKKHERAAIREGMAARACEHEAVRISERKGEAKKRGEASERKGREEEGRSERKRAKEEEKGVSQALPSRAPSSETSKLVPSQ